MILALSVVSDPDIMAFQQGQLGSVDSSICSDHGGYSGTVTLLSYSTRPDETAPMMRQRGCLKYYYTPD